MMFAAIGRAGPRRAGLRLALASLAWAALALADGPAAGAADPAASAVAPGAPATSRVAGASADELHAFLAQTTSASGDFAQSTTHSTQGAKAQLSSGHFEFLRPGRFIWSYSKPYSQRIVADGEHLYFYDQDLNQVTVKKLSGALSASPAAILFGSNDFDRQFTVKPLGLRDGLTWYEARPRARDASFEKVEIGLRNALPEAMRLVDGLGGVTQLTMSGLERNPKLSADHFHFTPPAGADVLQDQ